MAVADVPVVGLDHLDLTLTDLLTTLLLSDQLGSVVFHDKGDQFVVGHLGGFVHEASMDRIGGEIKGWWTARGLSHPVQEVCHRFLVLFVGCEPIRKASGNLTGCRLDRREIPTLGQDVDLVGVRSGFVHVASIGLVGSPGDP